MLRGQSKNYENFENVLKSNFFFQKKKKKIKKKKRKKKNIMQLKVVALFRYISPPGTNGKQNEYTVNKSVLNNFYYMIPNSGISWEF